MRRRPQEGGKSLGGPSDGLNVDDGTRRATPDESSPGPSSLFIRSTSGSWIPRPVIAPSFCFASSTYTNSPDHFFINISLSFPNLKPIKTFTLIDSGASASCISDRFAARHSFPRRPLASPIPITAVDDRPIANGLVTQDVLAQILVA